MILARCNRGFRYDHTSYSSGDYLEVHERAVERHPRTLSRQFDPRDHTVPEIEDRVDELDDEEIRVALAVERDHENRKTAVEALEGDLDG